MLKRTAALLSTSAALTVAAFAVTTAPAHAGPTGPVGDSASATLLLGFAPSAVTLPEGSKSVMRYRTATCRHVWCEYTLQTVDGSATFRSPRDYRRRKVTKTAFKGEKIEVAIPLFAYKDDRPEYTERFTVQMKARLSSETAITERTASAQVTIPGELIRGLETPCRACVDVPPQQELPTGPPIPDPGPQVVQTTTTVDPAQLPETVAQPAPTEPEHTPDPAASYDASAILHAGITAGACVSCATPTGPVVR
ncbi:MAG: hypothetical protein JHC84_04530 [Solirubrobacteraceae bacterium]|nr:hypothetical protein [Solirubrobacteraceae bacterium]